MIIIIDIVAWIVSPLLVAYILYLFSRLNPNKRQLTLRLKSQNKLPNLNLGSESKKLEIKWDGQSIDEITVAQLSISNSGKQEIKREDFDSDIKVTLPKENLLGISFINAVPPSFESQAKDALSPTEDGFILKRMLWNCKESVNIMVITKQPLKKKDCKLDVRITAGKINIIDNREADNYTLDYTKYLAVMISAGIMAILLFYFATTLFK